MKLKVTLATPYIPEYYRTYLDMAQYVESPKLDGVRCIVSSTGVWTRSMKLVPNPAVREWLEPLRLALEDCEQEAKICGFETPHPFFVDGELTWRFGESNQTWPETVSRVMRKKNNLDIDELNYQIFDGVVACGPPDWSFRMRSIGSLFSRVKSPLPNVRRLLHHKMVQGTIWARTQYYIERGYEGPDAPQDCRTLQIRTQRQTISRTHQSQTVGLR